MKSFPGIFLVMIAMPALAQHGHGAATRQAPASPHAELQADGQGAAPHAGPAIPADPHAGHRMPAAPAKGAQVPAHVGHKPDTPDPPAGPPPAAAFRGPAHAADSIFGAAAMASARETVRKEHGDIKSGMFLIDRLETALGRGRDDYAWDAQGWYGGDIDRLWVKTEGEGSFGKRMKTVEAQTLWSRALDPWWNLQAGLRHDFRAGPDRSHVVVGVQGLAPYWFEIDAALFLSDQGDATARIKAEYDQRLTRKLILQPAAELHFAAQDIPELGTGSGLSSAELGLRLRYQFVPEFAPYAGLHYARAFGETADYHRARDEQSGEWRFLIGIRSWF